MFSLEGKTALVTGCRRGIGRAMATALAEAGADIVGVSTTIKQASDVSSDIESLGRRFRPYACDFADRQALYRLIQSLQRDIPTIDILVNNAGTILRKPAHEHSDECWDRVVEIDLNAQFVLTREIAKGMLARGSGKIIFTASLMSFQGGINVPSYAASKGGIAQLTKALANEWGAKGVNVNAIAPGYVQTDFTQELQTDPVRSRQILERIPAGRWGKPEDFKGAVVFLASPASDYVHGTVLTVDGGWLAR